MKKYLSLVTFSHTIFAMPFAFIGFFLAVTTTGYYFEWLKLLMMVFCMVFARNSAMAFNRWADAAQTDRAALAIVPDDTALIMQLSRAYYRLHDYPDMIAQDRRYTALRPADGDGWLIKVKVSDPDDFDDLMDPDEYTELVASEKE